MKARLDKITVTDLRNICRKHFRTSTRDTVSRKNIYEALERQPVSIQNTVLREAVELSQTGKVRYARRPKQTTSRDESRPTKRIRLDSLTHRGTVLGTASAYAEDDVLEQGDVSGEREEDLGFEDQVEGAQETSPCGADFMIPPNQETIDDILVRFIEATGNEAIAQRPCCVCARSTPSSSLTVKNLEDIPNSHNLLPSTVHPAHFLINGLILHPKGLSTDKRKANVCKDCMHHLQKGKKPPLSLANDMWIGDVPYQLSNLSLAERLMIAKGFPCAYIFKLYPKQKGATNWDKSMFHNGMKGNVSTYKMNPAQLADITCGTSLPLKCLVWGGSERLDS